MSDQQKVIHFTSSLCDVLRAEKRHASLLECPETCLGDADKHGDVPDAVSQEIMTLPSAVHLYAADVHASKHA